MARFLQRSEEVAAAPSGRRGFERREAEVRLPGKEKVRKPGAVGSPCSAAGGRVVGEERRLRAELAAVNALFEAAAVGDAGESFARRVMLLAGKQRRP